MNIIRHSLIAAVSALSLAGMAQAQSTTTTTQSEMDRGVPGVNVDVGRNADGAVDIDRANTERARGVPGVDADIGSNARGAVDVDAGSANRADTDTSGMRTPRADRN